MNKENRSPNSPIIKCREDQLSFSRSIPSIFRRKKRTRAARAQKMEGQQRVNGDLELNKRTSETERIATIPGMRDKQNKRAAQGLTDTHKPCKQSKLGKTAVQLLPIPQGVEHRLKHVHKRHHEVIGEESEGRANDREHDLVDHKTLAECLEGEVDHGSRGVQ